MAPILLQQEQLEQQVHILFFVHGLGTISNTGTTGTTATTGNFGTTATTGSTTTETIITTSTTSNAIDVVALSNADDNSNSTLNNTTGIAVLSAIGGLLLLLIIKNVACILR